MCTLLQLELEMELEMELNHSKISNKNFQITFINIKTHFTNKFTLL
jgi:hypothetical protein